MMVSVNLVAVLASAIVNMIVGYLWYGPLFGKQWMKLVGMTEAKMEAGKKEAPKMYGIMFVATLIMAYVLAHFLNYANAQTLTDGAVGGFWAWLGFVATTQISGLLFSGKPMKLYSLETGYYLVILLIDGALLASWK